MICNLFYYKEIWTPWFLAESLFMKEIGQKTTVPGKQPTLSVSF